MDELYVVARRVLLDALEALGPRPCLLEPRPSTYTQAQPTWRSQSTPRTETWLSTPPSWVRALPCRRPSNRRASFTPAERWASGRLTAPSSDATSRSRWTFSYQGLSVRVGGDAQPGSPDTRPRWLEWSMAWRGRWSTGKSEWSAPWCRKSIRAELESWSRGPPHSSWPRSTRSQSELAPLAPTTRTHWTSSASSRPSQRRSSPGAGGS